MALDEKNKQKDKKKEIVTAANKNASVPPLKNKLESTPPQNENIITKIQSEMHIIIVGTADSIQTISDELIKEFKDAEGISARYNGTSITIKLTTTNVEKIQEDIENLMKEISNTCKIKITNKNTKGEHNLLFEAFNGSTFAKDIQNEIINIKICGDRHSIALISLQFRQMIKLDKEFKIKCEQITSVDGIIHLEAVSKDITEVKTAINEALSTALANIELKPTRNLVITDKSKENSNELYFEIVEQKTNE